MWGCGIATAAGRIGRGGAHGGAAGTAAARAAGAGRGASDSRGRRRDTAWRWARAAQRRHVVRRIEAARAAAATGRNRTRPIDLAFHHDLDAERTTTPG